MGKDTVSVETVVYKSIRKVKKPTDLNSELFIRSKNKGTLLSRFNGTFPRSVPPQRGIELMQLGDEFENYDDSFTDSVAYTEKPPKRKVKPIPKPDQEYSEQSNTSNNPYSAYQYEFPYQYPYDFFNMAPSPSNSATDTKTKTKKKPATSNQNNVKKSSKEPDKTIIPFISISVAPHQPKSHSQRSQNDSNASDTEPTNKSVYSPDKQQPPPDKAAYFNYLNTYTPNHNQYETDPIQHVPSVDNHKYNQLNPFSNQYPMNYDFNVPSAAANVHRYGYGPFSGYSPMFSRVPVLNIAPIGITSNLEHFGQNTMSHDSIQRSIGATDAVSSKKSIKSV